MIRRTFAAARIDADHAERGEEKRDEIFAQISAKQDVEEYVNAVVQVHEEFGQRVDEMKLVLIFVRPVGRIAHEQTAVNGHEEDGKRRD